MKTVNAVISHLAHASPRARFLDFTAFGAQSRLREGDSRSLHSVHTLHADQFVRSGFCPCHEDASARPVRLWPAFYGVENVGQSIRDNQASRNPRHCWASEGPDTFWTRSA